MVRQSKRNLNPLATHLPSCASKYSNSYARPAILLASDISGFLLAVLLALGLAILARWGLLGNLRYPAPEETPQILTVFFSSFFVLLVSSFSLGHYSQFRPFWRELREIIKIVVVIATFDVFLLFIIGVQFSRLWFGFFMFSLVVIIPYSRERAKLVMISKGMWYRPTYIVGTGDSARKTLNALCSDSSLGHRVIGFVDLSEHDNKRTEFEGLPLLRSLPAQTSDDSGIESQYKNAAKLVFAFDTVDELQRHETAVSNYIASQSEVTVIPPTMGLPLYEASVTGIFRHDTALLKLQNRLLSRRSRLVKRLVDLLLGTICLILFFPLCLIIAIFITRDHGPIFFKHSRIGRNGKEFNCYKFRSMTVDSHSALQNYLDSNPSEHIEWSKTQKLRNDPRVTKVGGYLRRTSMDELPQLWNVLIGEMSLVGPRPIVKEELDKYSNYSAYYLRMTPGMSGLWQVSGRTDTSYEERIRLDVWYSRNWSVWTDIIILIKTIKTLINRHGAY